MPELVVEVLSPGAANVWRDGEKKPPVYARHGVVEYWIVDWQQRTLEVCRHTGAALQHVETLSEHETLRTALLPGFEQPIAPLFNGVPRT